MKGCVVFINNAPFSKLKEQQDAESPGHPGDSAFNSVQLHLPAPPPEQNPPKSLKADFSGDFFSVCRS